MRMQITRRNHVSRNPKRKLKRRIRIIRGARQYIQEQKAAFQKRKTEAMIIDQKIEGKMMAASKDEVDNRPPIQEEVGRPTNDLGLSLLKEDNSNKGPGICTGDIGLSPNLEEERRFTPGKEKGKQKGRLVPAASDGSKNQGDLGSSSTIAQMGIVSQDSEAEVIRKLENMERRNQAVVLDLPTERQEENSDFAFLFSLLHSPKKKSFLSRMTVRLLHPETTFSTINVGTKLDSLTNFYSHPYICPIKIG
ncbi:hypothetical protein Ancab_032839 [Ancistrocladus abbreviatus]